MLELHGSRATEAEREKNSVPGAGVWCRYSGRIQRRCDDRSVRKYAGWKEGNELNEVGRRADGSEKQSGLRCQ